MLDLHRQWASMSSVEADEPPISSRKRTKSRAESDFIGIRESPPKRFSESSFSAENDSESAALTWLNVNVRVDDQSKKQDNCFKRMLNKCYVRPADYQAMTSDGKKILRHVTGYAKPGRLMAIMGSSGSGKTTLLNVLTKRNTKSLMIDGVVKVNGRPVSTNEIRRISAYVQQDDLFIGTLKVKEHLDFQARLRLGDEVSDKKRKRIVAKVLSELGLEKCADSIIGVKHEIKGISGGERKRLAFASEILSSPSMMFCDEPTSGLDSFMSQQVVAVLKSMSAKGKTIICTIHQPSSQVFKYFSDLCLLSEGRVAYMGPSDENVARIFESLGYPCPQNFNPSDHYIRTLAIEPNNTRECKQRVKKVIEAYRSTEIYRNAKKMATIEWHDDDISLPEDEKKFKSKYKANWLTQYRALFKRSVLQNVREPLLVNVRLIETTLIAILFGLLYYDTKVNSTTIQNINGLLFMFPIQTTFAFTFAVVHVFCQELPIFLREHFSNLYRVDTYYLAKTVSELPQYLFFPTLFTVIVYFMAGLTPNAAVFFTLVGINILASNVGISLGYVVSTAFIDLNLAMSVIPILIIPFMIFGGFYVNTVTVPIYFSWLQYLSFIKYAFEAVAINQWETIHNISGCENFTCPHNGTDVLTTLHFSPTNFTFDIYILCVMFVVLKFLAFFILLMRSKFQNY